MALTFGHQDIQRKIEYYAAVIELLPEDSVGPSAYAFTNPVPGGAGATTIDVAAYAIAIIRAYCAASYVALAHNHFDRNLKFSGLDADIGFTLRKPLSLYNREGEIRLVDNFVINRERGTMRLLR